jgi:hypothetical protein
VAKETGEFSRNPEKIQRMNITNWQITEREDTQEISAEIDGFHLWYRLPKSYPVSRAGDPFLAAAFLPAMLKGEPLEVDPSLPISPKLLENTLLLQEIHHNWNPALKIIPIQAKGSPAKPVNKGTFSFFSGGVDAIFTFLKRREEISHLVFIHGFDFFVDSETFRTAAARNESFARGFDKVVIHVETNYYSFGYHHNLSRVLTQGSTLASVALLLGFSRAYIPASDHYSYLAPLGSHPLTDPLYSNEWTEIVHDGAEARRVDKVIKVAECAPALATLTVCVEALNRNCGKCIKCLRTMITLRSLRATGAPFPPLASLKAVRRTDWSKEPRFLQQNIDLAAEKGDRELERTLRACKKKGERIRLFKEIDRVIFGGIIRRVRKKFARAPLAGRRVTTILPEE